MTPVRVAFGLLSLVMLAIAGFMAVRLRSRRFVGLGLLAVGIALALPVFRPALFEGVGISSLMMRMRLVVGFLSFLVLMITLESVRRFAMEERYALLWISTGLVLVVFAVYPDAVGWLAAATGMQYVTAITIVVFAFLLLVAFHFSLALSRYRADQKRLCQHAAALEMRVADLERKLAGKASGTDPAAGTVNTRDGRRK